MKALETRPGLQVEGSRVHPAGLFSAGAGFPLNGADVFRALG